MNKKTIKNIAKILGYIIIVICFIFIYRSFKKIDLSLLRNKINLIWIVNIVLFSLFYSFLFQLQGITWNINLEIISGSKTNIFEILSIYARANIAKYLPGNIFVFVGRHLILRKFGISDIRLILINFSEIFFFFGISLFLSLIGIFSGIIKLPVEIINMINLKIISTVFILFLLIVFIFIIIYNKRIFKEIIKLSTTKNIIKICLNIFLYLIYFIVYGILNVFIFKIFLNTELNCNLYLLVIAVFSISWVLGYVIPGASGGIGVRESILLILLTPTFGYTDTFIVAVLSRLITLFGELFAFVYGSIYHSRLKNINNLIGEN